MHSDLLFFFFLHYNVKLKKKKKRKKIVFRHDNCSIVRRFKQNVILSNELTDKYPSFNRKSLSKTVCGNFEIMAINRTFYCNNQFCIRVRSNPDHLI